MGARDTQLIEFTFQDVEYANCSMAAPSIVTWVDDTKNRKNISSAYRLPITFESLESNNEIDFFSALMLLLFLLHLLIG